MTTLVEQDIRLEVAEEVRATQRLARITGLLYLLIAILGMFAGTVSTSFIAKGNAAATAHNVLTSLALFRGSLVAWIVLLVADVAVAIALFILLKPIDRMLSLLAAAIRVMYVAIVAISLPNLFNALFVLTSADYRAGGVLAHHNAEALSSLNAFSTGFRIGLVVFGIHLIALGYLLFRSKYVPGAISILVVVAGVGYVAGNLGNLVVPDFSPVVAAVLLTSAAIGELALTVWLLVKGVQVRRQATLQRPVQVRTEEKTPISV